MTTTTAPRFQAAPRTVFWEIAGSPLGDFLLAGDGRLLVEVRLPGRWTERTIPAAWQRRDGALAPSIDQLDAYFRGARRDFDLDFAPSGTAFQRSVWAGLCTIAYGETATYGDIAARIGNPKACRAVGMANNRNPIALFIPCHRVIGADGSLTGYGGGLDMKSWLLDHERRHASS